MKYMLDTNVLLCWAYHSRQDHEISLAAIESLKQAGDELWICSQNLVEYWSVATRPTAANGLGLSITEADQTLTTIETLFGRLEDLSSVHDHWRRQIVLRKVSGKQVHDARLAAFMIAHGIRNLLTFNGSDFLRFSEIEPIHPASIVANP